MQKTGISWSLYEPREPCKLTLHDNSIFEQMDVDIYELLDRNCIKKNAQLQKIVKFV